MAGKTEKKVGSQISNRNYCKRVSQEQKIALVEFLEKHRGVIISAENTLFNSEASNEKWEEITKTLNRYTEGAYKNSSQWKRCWLDMRKQVRKKIASVNFKEKNHLLLANHEIVTALDERIINLMRKPSNKTRNNLNEICNLKDSVICDSIKRESSEDEEKTCHSVSTLSDAISDKSELYFSDIKKEKDEQVFYKEFPNSQSEKTRRNKRLAGKISASVNEEDQDFLKMRLAIEKDRVRALTDISCSIRYLADVIQSVMTSDKVRNS
ncbi:uncharacterized protein LOC129608680 [Condylostylus longicornis]|uniref:uncharacterized protein LOC129608680 n=1 Tax=Condylostylus longicornis TaxID=2530218 RepID=UPI00244E11B2|nr:uncharacterized protein LOC129608680 [Condylostylus longicornis]